MPRWTSFILALALAGAVTPSSAAGADDGERDDHDAARALVEAGVIRPLPSILADLEGSLGGRIIDVALDDEDGHWIYELTVVSTGGDLVEVDVDAASGALLGQH